MYFRAHVFHSFTVETPLTVFVASNKVNGEVCSAQCDCVSGAGAACNHIAALLFAMEQFSREKARELPEETSKTSKPMSWHIPPKKIVKPSAISDMTFKNITYDATKSVRRGTEKLQETSFDPRQVSQRSLSQDSLTRLMTDVRASFPDSAIFSFWDDLPTGTMSSTTQGIEDVLAGTALEPLVFYTSSHAERYMEASCCDVREATVQKFVEDQVLDVATVGVVERSTRGQAANEIWHLIRNGRLTSSRFGEILRRRDSTPSNRLVTDIVGYRDNRSNLSRATAWGRSNERHAIQAYVTERNQSRLPGKRVTVRSCGLHLLSSHSFIGASSDGIVVGEEEQGCLEVKCPYSIEKEAVYTLAPADIAKKFPQFYLREDADGKLHLQESHAYYAQVQGEMAVIGSPWCDFVVFTTGRLHIERIVFAPDFWSTKLLPCLVKFFRQCIAPEILTRDILKSM